MFSFISLYTGLKKFSYCSSAGQTAYDKQQDGLEEVAPICHGRHDHRILLCDFFLCGFLKLKVYRTQSRDIPELRERIVDAFGEIIEFIDRAKVFETVFGSQEEKEELVRKTDGYVIGDLKRLSERATLMKIQRIYSGGCCEPNCTVEDFHEALVDFQPLNLLNIGLNKEQLRYSWKDVGGMEEVKKILTQTLIWPAKHPFLYESCPLRLARGILLYGPSGTGKTLVASAIAKECSFNFISVKGPELLSKYIGASEQSVRDTFARRGHDSTGVTDRVVNQLLTELDGVEALEGVFILAATSRPDLLDPALLRPGRIDRYLHCKPPDFTERKDIFRAISREMNLSATVDFSEISQKTEGFTGADLKSLLLSAQIKAMHRLHESGLSSEISQVDLLSALSETRKSLHSKPKVTRAQQHFQLVDQEKSFQVGNRVTLA